MRRGTSSYDEATRAEAAAMRADGCGYKAIAKALGVPRETVRGWLRGEPTGGYMARPRKHSEEARAKARAVFDRGGSPAEMAHASGMNIRTAQHWRWKWRQDLKAAGPKRGELMSAFLRRPAPQPVEVADELAPRQPLRYREDVSADVGALARELYAGRARGAAA